MPEGPEVTVIAKGLNDLLKDTYIVNFEYNEKSRYRTKKPDGYNLFTESIETINNTKNNKGVKIISIKNKGKFIYWTFNNGYYLMQTLGLSGGWFKDERRSTGCILYFKRWNNDIEFNKLYYDDQRRFGTMKFTNDKSVLDKKLKEIGPDVLNEKFEFTEWQKIIKQKKLMNKPIFKVITDQKIISGIGNYLKAEILYRARLSPHRLVKDIADSEIALLYKSIKTCITESYSIGGVSIQNYSDIEGNDGKYGLELLVYRKKKDKHGNTVKPEKIGTDSQTTYWVPAIQK